MRLLRRLLAERAPVSTRLGSLEDGTVLVVALLLTWGDFSRVHHHATLDVVTVHEVRDRTLLLYDVVGPTLPPLDQLTESIDADRVMVLFPPERLGDGFHPVPWDASGAQRLGVDDTILMARGPFVETGPFMLQPLEPDLMSHRLADWPLAERHGCAGARSAGSLRGPLGAPHIYCTPMVSATRAGLSWPSISIVISEVMRTPPGMASTLARRWRRRMRAPAWTGLMKRTLLEP